MTARKKTTAKKATRKKAVKKRTTKSTLTRIEDELPPNLRDYAKQVHKQMNALERDLERAVPKARRGIARLIREASRNLGAAEARGEKAWQKRAAHLTRDSQKLMRKLERAVAPKPRRRATKR
jgi:hypothetical protein